MELIERARGHLKVRVDDRVATIYGEAFLRGHGSPDFLVYSNSLEKWDEPHARENLSEIDKNRIFAFLRDEFLRNGMAIEF